MRGQLPATFSTKGPAARSKICRVRYQFTRFGTHQDSFPDGGTDPVVTDQRLCETGAEHRRVQAVLADGGEASYAKADGGV